MSRGVGLFCRVGSSAISARVATLRAGLLGERNRSAFRVRVLADVGPWYLSHGPVSLLIVNGSAYHYWQREAIISPGPSPNHGHRTSGCGERSRAAAFSPIASSGKNPASNDAVGVVGGVACQPAQGQRAIAVT
jgi:hypothetical protein